MEKLFVIKEQIKVLQTELNLLIENVENEGMVSSEVKEISERLDILIVALHKLAG